jgi:hypothetical protein
LEKDLDSQKMTGIMRPMVKQMTIQKLTEIVMRMVKLNDFQRPMGISWH